MGGEGRSHDDSPAPSKVSQPRWEVSSHHVQGVWEKISVEDPQGYVLLGTFYAVYINCTAHFKSS